jgi:hypothetical protein
MLSQHMTVGQCCFKAEPLISLANAALRQTELSPD